MPVLSKNSRKKRSTNSGVSCGTLVRRPPPTLRTGGGLGAKRRVGAGSGRVAKVGRMKATKIW